MAAGGSAGAFKWIGAAAPAAPVVAPNESIWGEWSRTVDHWTLRACLALFGVGVVLAFATSPDLAHKLAARRGVEVEPFAFAWRHLTIGALAFAVLLACSFLSPSGVRRIGVALAAVGLISLVLVLIVGVERGSSRRWFSYGGVSVQPSEFLKPGLILFSAWMLSAIGGAEKKTARTALVVGGAAAALGVGLLILQPDYGQSALILAVWAAMYFVAGGSVVALGLVGLAVAGVGYAAYLFEPHIAARIDAFLDPSVAAGGQVALAERAIAAGGWFGVGVGEGVRKGSLPDAHADFVIAVAAEEYGFALAGAVALAFAAIAIRALLRAARIVDPFQRLAAVGLALLIGLQAFVHVGVSAQILPATGMTLPFISLGGSSMIAAATTVGLLLALTRRAPPPS